MGVAVAVAVAEEGLDCFVSFSFLFSLPSYQKRMQRVTIKSHNFRLFTLSTNFEIHGAQRNVWAWNTEIDIENPRFLKCIIPQKFSCSSHMKQVPPFRYTVVGCYDLIHALPVVLTISAVNNLTSSESCHKSLLGTDIWPNLLYDSCRIAEKKI